MKTRLLISFSGGETSAFMTQWLWRHKRDEYDIVIVFANTGQENQETLNFIQQCSVYYDFPVVWVEAEPRVLLNNEVVKMSDGVFGSKWGGRIGTTHKVVDFETANTDGSVFEKVIQKYGIPNMATPYTMEQKA